MKRTFLLVIGVLALAGCKEQVLAQVNCEVKAGPVVECTIAQTKGTAEVEVCWDFKVACDSGATLDAARTCAKVSGGKTSNATIPADKLKMTGSCTGEKKATITNMTLNGQKSQI